MRMLEYTRLFYRKREAQATFCLTNSVLGASLVESIVAAHLKQRYGRDVFYWKPDHEVDFLVFSESKLHQLIEVKYQEKNSKYMLHSLLII
jgi:predicted AAA+ superfamily ATPase